MKTGCLVALCFVIAAGIGFAGVGNAAAVSKFQPAPRVQAHQPVGPPVKTHNIGKPADRPLVKPRHIRLLPDLVVQKIWLDRSHITFRIRNAGRGPIPENQHRRAKVKVGIKIYSFAMIDPQGILMLPGRAVTYTIAGEPVSGPAKHCMTITVFVDCTRKIHEQNEGNNTQTVCLSVPTRMRAAKTQPAAGTPKPAGRHTASPQVLSSMPAISVERIFLHHGTVHVQLKNTGRTNLTRTQLRATTLHLFTGSKAHAWHLAEIDRGRHLWHPGGSFDFDTGAAVAERTRVIVRLEKTARAKTRTVVLWSPHTPPLAFQGSNVPLGSLSVVLPNGGEQWRAGKSYAVLWRSADFHENIRVRLLADGGSYSRILYRSINADLGRAMIHIPADVPTGGYKIRVESMDHTVSDETNGTFTILGIRGFAAPDLQIIGIRHLIHPGRIGAQIRNNGTSWRGSVQLRIVYHDPDGFYSETRNTTLDLDLGPGEGRWIDIINPFRWQHPLDMPRLVFLVQVDPDGDIAESDERNNQFQEELAIPCGLHISGLSHSWLYEGPAAQMFLYGSFGAERKAKTVGVLDEENHLYKVFPRKWEAGSLKVDMQSFPVGRYRFVVYCSDPDGGSAYASNISSWVEIRRSENHSGGGPFSHESPVDARKLVSALSEEFVPAGTNFQVRIERIWVEHVSDGWKTYATIHGALSVSLKRVTFEIWEGPERIRYGEVKSFHKTNSGNYEEHFVFQELPDGAYTLRCNILDTLGNHDQKSFGFILSGTHVQADN